MDVPRNVRMEMNALSKEVFGASSRWIKMYKGVRELITKTVKETVPGDKGAPDTVKEVVVPDLAPNGAKQYRFKQYTLEEIKTQMFMIKKFRDDYNAKTQAAKRRQEIEKKMMDEAGGKISL